MNLNQKLHRLRTVQDEAIVRQIETLCPADWGTDRRFAQCCRKAGQHAGSTVSRPRARYAQGIGLAACFLLTVGFGVSLWAKQQPVASRPPQSAPVVTTETDTTESTAAAPHSTQAAASPTETTAAPTTSPALPPTNAAVETQSLPEAAPASTQAPAVSPTDAAEPQRIPEPTQAPAIAPAVSPTEAAPAPATEAATTPITESVSEAGAMLADVPINGFTVMQYPGYRQIICTDAFPEPDGVLTAYTVEDSRLHLLAAADDAAAVPTRTYEIEENGRIFTVTQQEYATFVLDVAEGDLIDLGIRQVHGFFLMQEDLCTVYWFCGGEGFRISGDIADLGSYLAIVRSFTPVEQ